MSIEGERRNHFRGRSQAGRRIDVIYRRASGENTKEGPAQVSTVTANIGVGGISLQSPAKTTALACKVSPFCNSRVNPGLERVIFVTLTLVWIWT